MLIRWTETLLRVRVLLPLIPLFCERFAASDIRVDGAGKVPCGVAICGAPREPYAETECKEAESCGHAVLLWMRVSAAVW